MLLRHGLAFPYHDIATPAIATRACTWHLRVAPRPWGNTSTTVLASAPSLWAGEAGADGVAHPPHLGGAGARRCAG